MGKASITISVGALWNGGPELKKVNSDLKTMAARVAALDKSTTQGLALSGQHVENLGNKIYGMGAKIEGIGRSLTNNVTVPMSVVGGYCVNQAVDFDTSLANLNKTADLTSDQLKALGDAALEASTTQPVTAAQIINAEALGAQLGITTDNLKSFSDVANGLDIATNMDMETAATEMAQFANITSMGQDKLSNYGSTIVDLGNHLATTESDISHMSLRLAGMTTTANFTQAEILGMAGAMSSLGIKAEAGGSAMTQIVSNITKAVANGSGAVEEYARVSGMSADEFAAKWQSSPMEALESLIDGINRLSNEGQATDVTLTQLGIKSIRQADVMRRLSGNTDVLHEAIGRANSAWQDNTALTEEVDKRNESLESRFQTLKNKADAAAIKIGGPLAEALLDVADDLSPVIDGIADACQAFADMDSGTQGTILALAGVAAAAGPVLTVTGKITQGVGNVITAFGKTQTQAAIFGDSLNTIDGASMRVYASTDSMATKLGIAGNAAAKAAGGAENYVSAWEKMTDAAKVAAVSQEKYTAALDKARSTSGKTSEKALELAESYEYQRNAALKAYEDNAKLVSTYSGSTKEAEKAATAAEKATKSFSAEGNGCDVLRSSLDKVKSGTDYAASQTEALSKAMENGKKSAGTLGSKLATIGNTAKSYASNVGTFFAEFAKANAASIAVAGIAAAVGFLYTQYQKAQEAQELYNKATMTTADIMGGAESAASKLGSAIGSIKPNVDGTLKSLADLNGSVKEQFTSYEVSSGKLDEYVGVINELANKSGLTATEQWKLSQAVEGYNSVCGTSYSVTDATNGKIADGSGVIQENTDKINENAQAWKRNAEAQAYQEVATQYLEEKIKAEHELALAQDEVNRLENEYNNAATDAAKAVINSQLKEARDNVDKLSGAVDTATKNYEDFGARAQLAISDLDSAVKDAVSEMPASMQQAGTEMALKFSEAISNGSISASDAANFLGSTVTTNLSGMSGDTLEVGLLVAQNLADGIANGSVTVDQASSVLASYAQSGIPGLEQAYANAGLTCPQSMATSMLSSGQTVEDAGRNIADRANTGASAANGKLSATGTTAGGGFASGVGSAYAAASGAGKNIAGGANSGASSGSSALRSTGSNAGGGFASGVGSSYAAASSAGKDIANAAQGGAESWNANTSGSHLGSQFASGIGSAWNAVRNKALELVNAAKSVMGFSVPDDGPWAGSEKGGVTSGMHLGENFARGMALAVPTVRQSALDLAAAANPTVALGAYDTVPSLAGVPSVSGSGQTVHVTNNNVYINGAKINNLSAHAQELIGELFGEVGVVAGMGY